MPRSATPPTIAPPWAARPPRLRPHAEAAAPPDPRASSRMSVTTRRPIRRGRGGAPGGHPARDPAAAGRPSGPRWRGCASSVGRWRGPGSRTAASRCELRISRSPWIDSDRPTSPATAAPETAVSTASASSTIPSGLPPSAFRSRPDGREQEQQPEPEAEDVAAHEHGRRGERGQRERGTERRPRDERARRERRCRADGRPVPVRGPERGPDRSRRQPPDRERDDRDGRGTRPAHPPAGRRGRCTHAARPTRGSHRGRRRPPGPPSAVAPGSGSAMNAAPIERHEHAQGREPRLAGADGDDAARGDERGEDDEGGRHGCPPSGPIRGWPARGPGRPESGGSRTRRSASSGGRPAR